MSYAEVKQMTTYETKTENIAWDYQKGRFVTVTVTLDNGYEKVIDAFEGTIDYVAKEQKAGYQIGSRLAENYKFIEWMQKYRVSYIPTPYAREEYAEFDSLEEAVRFYMTRDTNWKVLYQKRKLVDGTIDTNAVTYRWN